MAEGEPEIESKKEREVASERHSECMVERTVAGVSAAGEAGWSCGCAGGGLWIGDGVQGCGSRMADMMVAGVTLSGEAGGEGVWERQVDIAAGSVLCEDETEVRGSVVAAAASAADADRWVL